MDNLADTDVQCLGVDSVGVSDACLFSDSKVPVSPGEG